MSKQYIEPEEIECYGSPVHESKITHPAFAQIRASRVSGNATLYGSEFNHQHYVTITICKSELNRGLSRDWPFPKEELIDVSLSEAQWATFVSTLNHGSGVQCTLNHINCQDIPGILSQKESTKRFKDEAQKAMDGVLKSIKKILEGIDGPLSKTKAMELKRNLEFIHSRVTGNIGFVASQFDEHMENNVEKAKIEIEAYAANTIQRAGLDSIAGKQVLLLTEHKEKE